MTEYTNMDQTLLSMRNRFKEEYKYFLGNGEIANTLYVKPDFKDSTNVAATKNVVDEDGPNYDSLKQKILTSNDDIVSYVIFGDSGMGKTSFGLKLCNEIWEERVYANSNNLPIPIYLHLSKFTECANNLFDAYIGKSEPHEVNWFKSQNLLFILDGYEAIYPNQNLYILNQWGSPPYSNVKVVILSRIENMIAKSGRSKLFSRNFNVNNVEEKNSYKEYHLEPFSSSQISNYIDNFVAFLAKYDLDVLKGTPWEFVKVAVTKNSGWTSEKYCSWFKRIPDLKKLSKTPFVLSLILQLLPTMVGELDVNDDDVEMDNARRMCLTKSSIYAKFIDAWFDFQIQRIGSVGNLSSKELKSYLLAYAQNLAQSKVNNVSGLVRDEGFRDSQTVDIKFAEPIHDEALLALFNGGHKKIFLDEKDILRTLRNACLVQFGSNEFRFLHHSILEHFLARDLVEGLQGTFDYFLNSVDLTSEDVQRKDFGFSRDLLLNKAVVSDLAEMARTNQGFSYLLNEIIEKSKDLPLLGKISANAISILNIAGFNFTRRDFRHAQFPGANLSHSLCDATDFRGANLEGAEFYGAWLTNAKFPAANFKSLNFGDSFELDNKSWVMNIKFHGDKLFCLSDQTTIQKGYKISRWDFKSALVEKELIFEEPKDLDSIVATRIPDFGIYGEYLITWRDKILVYLLKRLKQSKPFYSLEMPWTGKKPKGDFVRKVILHESGGWILVMVREEDDFESEDQIVNGKTMQLYKFKLPKKKSKPEVTFIAEIQVMQNISCLSTNFIGKFVESGYNSIILSAVTPIELAFDKTPHPDLNSAQKFTLRFKNPSELDWDERNFSAYTYVFDLNSPVAVTGKSLDWDSNFHLCPATDFFGDLVAVGGDNSPRIQIWDLPQNKLIKSFIAHNGGKITELKYNSTGRILVSASSTLELKVWDTRNEWNSINTFTNFSNVIERVDFSVPFREKGEDNDSEWIGAISLMSNAVLICKVNAGAEIEMSRITHEKFTLYEVHKFAMSDDRELFVFIATEDRSSSKDKFEECTMHICKSLTGEEINCFEINLGKPTWPYPYLFFIRGHNILILEGKFQIINLKGQIVRTMDLTDEQKILQLTSSYFVSPSGLLFVHASERGRVDVINIMDNFKFIPHVSLETSLIPYARVKRLIDIWSLCFNLAETRLYCSTCLKKLQIWDIESGERISNYDYEEFMDIKLCLNESVLLCCTRTHLFMIQVDTGSVLHSCEMGYDVSMEHFYESGFKVAYDSEHHLIATNGFDKRILQIRKLSSQSMKEGPVLKIKLWFTIRDMIFLKQQAKTDQAQLVVLSSSAQLARDTANILCIHVSLSNGLPESSHIEWAKVSNLRFSAQGANITQAINLSPEQQILLHYNGAIGNRAPGGQAYTSRGNILKGIMGTATLDPVSPYIQVESEQFHSISASEWVLTAVIQNVDLDAPIRLPGREKRRHLFLVLEGILNKRRFIVRTELYATKKKKGYYTLISYDRLQDFRNSMGKYEFSGGVGESERFLISKNRARQLPITSERGLDLINFILEERELPRDYKWLSDNCVTWAKDILERIDIAFEDAEGCFHLFMSTSAVIKAKRIPK